MSSPILITGAGRRLGLRLALHLIENGQAVIATYRTKTKGIERLLELGAGAYRCDFYDDTSVDKLIQNLKHEHPRLRAIIHNASDWLPEKDHNPSEVIDKMLKVHVHAPYKLNLALSDNLKLGASPYSDIIHITDYVANKGSKKHIAYAASKAALENLGLSFASAYAPKIKVNNIAPALMIFKDSDTDDYKEKAREKSVLETVGGESEFINSIEFILQSHYMTGQTLHLNGGRNLK